MTLTIALSGVDGCGKSTFTKKLWESWDDSRVMHSNPRTRETFKGKPLRRELIVTMDKILQYYSIRLAKTRREIILDRCFLDARVYSGYFARREKLTVKRKVLEFLSKFATLFEYHPDVIIIVNPSVQIIKQRQKLQFEERIIQDLQSEFVGMRTTLSKLGYNLKPMKVVEDDVTYLIHVHKRVNADGIGPWMCTMVHAIHGSVKKMLKESKSNVSA